jgi:addiction module HigA family antidote
MTQMFRFNSDGIPPSPGEVLKAKILDGMELTQVQLARAIGISTPRLNMILKGRCQMSAEIALRIEKVFDIAPQYWLRIRNEHELFEERRRMANEIEALPEFTTRKDRETSAWLVREWQAAP